MAQTLRYVRFAAGTTPAATRSRPLTLGGDGGEERPLVSCLMVTRGDPHHVRAAHAAFQAQTYAPRELVIVAERPAEELQPLVGPGVRLSTAPPGLSLGEKRNLCVARSRGSLLCTWDDDDLYDPQRLAVCARVLVEAAVDAVFLNRVLLWWPERNRLALSHTMLWENTLFVRREALGIYPALERGEDTVVVNRLVDRSPIALLEAPHLYCYRHTGSNVSSTEHFEKLFARAGNLLEGEDAERVLRCPCFTFARGGPVA